MGNFDLEILKARIKEFNLKTAIEKMPCFRDSLLTGIVGKEITFHFLKINRSLKFF
jgi:hypothetical protein